jgi:hypothetical protein
MVMREPNYKLGQWLWQTDGTEKKAAERGLPAAKSESDTWTGGTRGVR